MQLSSMELHIIEQLAQGNNTIPDITRNLKKHNSRIYRTKQELIKKDLVQFNQGRLEPKRHTYMVLLMQLLSHYPNLIPLLSGSGIPILISLLASHSIADIEKQTDVKKSTIYRKIQQAIHISVVIQTDKKTYTLNEKIWKDIIVFLKEIKKHEETTDPRIPANSILYYKTSKEILFSNKNTLQASLTGFSIYHQFGIQLLIPTNYYYLPEKPLSKEEVLIHSLYITQKETSIRNLTYIGLFYSKCKDDMQNIQHPILDMIKLVLNGKTITGYPTREELQEKADVYDIKL